jgi:uncharacterized protein
LDHDFDAGIVTIAAHRPWRMPDSPWVMTQTWRDLLFAHWRVDADALRAKVPAAFPLDLFDGKAFVGVVPFRMTNVAPRGVPSLPGISEFPELNVRTYVSVDDKPGVYFFSLDAGNALAVRTARALLNLPYFKAAMSVTPIADVFAYQSRRDLDGAEFVATYGPAGDTFVPARGTLEYFLTERYCLYNVDRRGRPYRMDIHHPLWTLQPARATLTRNMIARASGIALPEEPPLLHFSARQDMVAWAPTGIR